VAPLSTMELDTTTPAELLARHRTPADLFEHYGLPVTRVPGVISVTAREFHYDFAEFKRVELVAKRYYENQGCLANWSEGTSFSILRDAFRDCLLSGLANCYRYTENILTDRRTAGATWNLDNDWLLANGDAHAYAPYLTAYVYFDLAGQVFEPPTEGQAEFERSMVRAAPLFELAVPVQKLAERYHSQLDSIRQSMSVMLSHYIKARAKKFADSGLDKYGSANYIEEFLLKAMETMVYQPALNPVAVHDVYCSGFDLLVFDPSTGLLRFVEVKNKDKLTHGQLTNLLKYLRSNMPYPQVELCVVQPV